MPSPGQSEDGPATVALPEPVPSPHATCPPDEDRQLTTIRDELGITVALRNVSMARIVRDSTAQEGDVESGPESDAHDGSAKHMSDVDAALLRGSPSPVIPQDERTQQELRQTSHATSTTLPQIRPAFISSPDGQRVRPNSTSSFLRPGSKFVGTQQSDRQVYNVQVEIKYVDMERSSLSGYLRIQGLTDDHPTLTTYFEGEIIGNKHTFKTAHPEWGSSEKVDMQHWARFPAWRPLMKQARSPAFTFKNFAQREHLFMRWKEYFLVPDHKVKTITGASFEGFYYISFNQCTGSVSGIYFHAKSEKFQQLELEHVNDRGCTGAIEFR